MTTAEFSVEFDTLYNNVKSQSAPGLDEYEKSVFLTKAQEEIIKNYFNPTSNKLQQGFDDSGKRQMDFAEILRTANIFGNTPTPGTYTSIDQRAQLFLLPSDTWIVTNEQVTVTDGVAPYLVTVVPLNYREYDRLMSKPYKEPVKRQAWRLIQGNSTTPVTANGQQAVSEIITKSSTAVVRYVVRYVKKPQPIILDNLSTWGLSINGVTAISDCELNPIIHREILDRAVELAKLAYEDGSLQSTVQINQRNE